MAVEEDFQERGMGSLMVKAGEEEGEGGRGEARGRAGGGVKLQQRWEGPLAIQFDGDNKLSQTNRGVQGVGEWNVSRVQRKLSRALHAHSGNKLAGPLKPEQHDNEESCGKVLV